MKVIASGGISSGIDCAKSIAFGADFAASAMSILQRLASGGTESGSRANRSMGMGIERCNVFNWFAFHCRFAETNIISRV